MKWNNLAGVGNRKTTAVVQHHPENTGSFLPPTVWRRIIRAYHAESDLAPALLLPDGRRVDDAATHFDRLPLVIQARRNAIAESLRWGEPQVFFVTAGVFSWVVAMVDGQELRGGICGGEVTCDDDPVDVPEAAAHLTVSKAEKQQVSARLAALPVWPQPSIRLAAKRLAEMVYNIANLDPVLWKRNRDDAAQQRQIAEAIQLGKDNVRRDWPFAEEKRLLLLLRAGDHNGARKHLNQLLASMFLDSPRQPVLQARVLELFGYLVRVAVEDSPALAPLMSTHQRWIEWILNAHTFEELCQVVRDALDAFIHEVAYQGAAPTSLHVRRALDYVAENLTGSISLAEAAKAAGISRFRLAHLLKATTGQTLLEHVKRLRTDEARRRLETTTLSCAAIAAELGFADQSHFTRQFRDVTGITPARYRRERRLK
jgi:AraC-like DNA-binding protein